MYSYVWMPYQKHYMDTIVQAQETIGNRLQAIGIGIRDQVDKGHYNIGRYIGDQIGKAETIDIQPIQAQEIRLAQGLSIYRHITLKTSQYAILSVLIFDSAVLAQVDRFLCEYSWVCSTSIKHACMRTFKVCTCVIFYTFCTDVLKQHKFSYCTCVI